MPHLTAKKAEKYSFSVWHIACDSVNEEKNKKAKLEETNSLCQKSFLGSYKIIVNVNLDIVNCIG